MDKQFNSYLFHFNSPKKNNDKYSNHKLYQFNNDRFGIKKIIRVKFDKDFILNKKINDIKNNNSLTENSTNINNKSILNENNGIINKNKNQFFSKKLKNIYKIKQLLKERPNSVNLDNYLNQKGRNIKSDFDLFYSKTETSKNKYKTKISSIKNFDKIINFKTIDNTYKNNQFFLSRTTSKTPNNKKEKFKDKFISPYNNKKIINRKKKNSNLIFMLLNNILTEKNEIDNYRKNQFLNLKEQLKIGRNKISEVFNELKTVQFHSDTCLKNTNYLFRNINDINAKYGF